MGVAKRRSSRIPRCLRRNSLSLASKTCRGSSRATCRNASCAKRSTPIDLSAQPDFIGARNHFSPALMVNSAARSSNANGSCTQPAYDLGTPACEVLGLRIQPKRTARARIVETGPVHQECNQVHNTALSAWMVRGMPLHTPSLHHSTTLVVARPLEH